LCYVLAPPRADENGVGARDVKGLVMMRHSWMMALALALLAGCTATIPISHYPTFAEFDEIDAVGVQAFTVLPETDRHNLGVLLAGKLSAALKVNGTYATVYNLGYRSTHPSIEAVITGSVIEFDVRERTNFNLRPVYRTDAQGVEQVDSYQEVPHRSIDVTLAVMAQLVRKDGEILHATTIPVSANVHSEGDPPPMSTDHCVNLVIDQVIEQLLTEFAITNTTVTVVIDDAIFTAGEPVEGNWVRQDTFVVGEQVNVVITLPPEVDRNEFMLVLRRADSPEVTSSHLLRWERAYSDSGWSASLDAARLAAHGLGRYRLELSISGSNPLLWCEFTLNDPPPVAPEPVEMAPEQESESEPEVAPGTEVLPAEAIDAP
jgi:hypothetical protein